MKDKVKEIKKALCLNDRQLADYLAFSRNTLYVRMKKGNWHTHEIHYINTKHKELCEQGILR